MMEDNATYTAVYNALKRERLARKSAEKIIEEKSTEIYYVNKELKMLNQNLEQRISERTEVIEESKRELEIAMKMAEEATLSKSSFLSNMSHEIRTPLNGIIGITELLLDEKLAEDTLRMLGSIKYSADNLLKIINEILDFSKIEAGKISFEEVDFNLKRLIEELLKNMKFTAQAKSLELLSKIDEAIPKYVCGDPVKLTQILTNLIGNAVKFTSSGYVKLVLRLSDEKLENGKKVLHFIIKDTGIGIPKNKLDSIFESFQQSDSSTSRKFGGTGLGLTISKDFVEMQGGKMSVESEEGKGSSFIFSYPYSDVEVINSHLLEEQKIYEFSPLNISVLLVEDNKLNQFVSSQFLKKWNIKVDIANNGEEAIYFLSQNKYDIVLMDIQMPIMNGLQASKKIRNENSSVLQHNIPIIALTANAFEETRKEIDSVGMNGFVSKPLIPKILHQKIKVLSQA
ncbi:MAG: response regulator [Bacteroidales bacterium]|nr:response regulator [Bacteroidales bacterium]